MLPSDARASALRLRSSIVIPSAFATRCSWSITSRREIRRKVKCWHRDRIVWGILCDSVVAKINTTWLGGSSRGLRNASPARDHYRVYIIDEVHLGSSAAFNALVKYPTGPPTHVGFSCSTTQ